MSLQEQFAQAQADSKNLPERPDNMTLLKIQRLRTCQTRIRGLLDVLLCNG